MPLVEILEVKMSLLKNLLMLSAIVNLMAATTKIKAKKFIRIFVEEDSWVRNEISSLRSHGSVNEWVSFRTCMYM